MPPGGSGQGGCPRRPPALAGPLPPPPPPPPLPLLLGLLLLLGAAEGARVSSSLSTTHHVHHFHSKHGTVPIAINRMPFLTRSGHGKWRPDAGGLACGAWVLRPGPGSPEGRTPTVPDRKSVV